MAITQQEVEKILDAYKDPRLPARDLRAMAEGLMANHSGTEIIEALDSMIKSPIAVADTATLVAPYTNRENALKKGVRLDSANYLEGAAKLVSAQQTIWAGMGAEQIATANKYGIVHEGLYYPPANFLPKLTQDALAANLQVKDKVLATLRDQVLKIGQPDQVPYGEAGGKITKYLRERFGDENIYTTFVNDNLPKIYAPVLVGPKAAAEYAQAKAASENTALDFAKSFPDFVENAKKYLEEDGSEHKNLIAWIYGKDEARAGTRKGKGLISNVEFDQFAKNYEKFAGFSVWIKELNAKGIKAAIDSLPLDKIEGVDKLFSDNIGPADDKKFKSLAEAIKDEDFQNKVRALSVPLQKAISESAITPLNTAAQVLSAQIKTQGLLGLPQVKAIVKEFMEPNEDGVPTKTYFDVAENPKFKAAIASLPDDVRKTLMEQTKDQAALTTLAAQTRAQLAQAQADAFEYKTLVQPQLDALISKRTNGAKTKFGVQDLTDAAKTGDSGLSDLANQLTEDGTPDGKPLPMKVRKEIMDDWRKQIQDPANAVKAEWERMITGIKVEALKGAMAGGADPATALADVNIAVSHALMGGHSVVGGGRARLSQLKIPTLQEAQDAAEQTRKKGADIPESGKKATPPVPGELTGPVH